MPASVPQSATELNFYTASSPGPDSYQTTSSHNIGALAQSGIQEDDGFSGSLLYLAAQAGLVDGETKCVHRYLLLLCSRYNGTPRSGREGRCRCMLLVDYLLA